MFSGSERMLAVLGCAASRAHFAPYSVGKRRQGSSESIAVQTSCKRAVGATRPDRAHPRRVCLRPHASFYAGRSVSKARLQSKPIRWLVCDEVRHHPPGRLAMVLKRTRSFWNWRRLLNQPETQEGDRAGICLSGAPHDPFSPQIALVWVKDAP